MRLGLLLRRWGTVATLALTTTACSVDEVVDAVPAATNSSTGTGAGGAGGGATIDLLAGADCDPMVPTHCGFPFPSNVYLVGDPATVTGKRVAFRANTLPADKEGAHLVPDAWAD